MRGKVQGSSLPASGLLMLLLVLYMNGIHFKGDGVAGVYSRSPSYCLYLMRGSCQRRGDDGLWDIMSFFSPLFFGGVFFGPSQILA